jgi:hypothetical protein
LITALKKINYNIYEKTMLRTADAGARDQAVGTPGRVVALDRARSFITLLLAAIRRLRSGLPAFVKFAIVFTGTLSISWALTVLLRKATVVARMI